MKPDKNGKHLNIWYSTWPKWFCSIAGLHGKYPVTYSTRSLKFQGDFFFFFFFFWKSPKLQVIWKHWFCRSEYKAEGILSLQHFNAKLDDFQLPIKLNPLTEINQKQLHFITRTSRKLKTKNTFPGNWNENYRFFQFPFLFPKRERRFLVSNKSQQQGS